MQPESGIKTWQWVVTVIVVIILIVIGVMVFGNKGAQAPAEPTPTPTANNQPGVNSVVVSDQYPGNVVYVSSVQLANPGWVAIHKDNAGKPGAIIGEAYLPAGINPAKVILSAPMVDGGTYYAMLHSDDGDQKFDAAKDMPLTDSNGNVVMRVFHASASAGSNLKG